MSCTLFRFEKNYFVESFPKSSHGSGRSFILELDLLCLPHCGELEFIITRESKLALHLYTGRILLHDKSLPCCHCYSVLRDKEERNCQNEGGKSKVYLILNFVFLLKQVIDSKWPTFNLKKHFQ